MINFKKLKKLKNQKGGVKMGKIIKTGRKCPVCGGEIVKEISYKITTVPVIIGINANNYEKIEIFYCSKCGIIFKKLPSKNLKGINFS